MPEPVRTMPPLPVLAQLALGSLTLLLGIYLMVATDRTVIGVVLLVLGGALEGVMMMRLLAWAKTQPHRYHIR